MLVLHLLVRRLVCLAAASTGATEECGQSTEVCPTPVATAFSSSDLSGWVEIYYITLALLLAYLAGFFFKDYIRITHKVL